jgi:starch synthase (maltosyl-transferring)
MEPSQRYAPRIYFLHSLLVGPLDAWPAQFAHAAALGFDHVLIGALFQPGRAGHAQIVSDHRKLHPVFGAQQDAPEALRGLTAAADQHGLKVLADVVIDRFAADSALFSQHPDWFHPFESEEARLDPRHAHREDNVAYVNFGNEGSTAALLDWWTRELVALAEAGVAGFRFDSPHRVPVAFWRQLGAAVRAQYPEIRFLAATPGLARGDLQPLDGAGFDSVFSSVRWWDFRSSWMTDEHASLIRIGAPIAFPEAPYGTRLAADLDDVHDAAMLERAYRRALFTAASTGTGWLLPMGFEYGVATPMSYTRANAAQYAEQCKTARFDLSGPIKHINEVLHGSEPLQSVGELRALSGPSAPAAVLLRGDHLDLRDSQQAILIVINPDLGTPLRVDSARFLAGVPGNFTRFVPLDAPANTKPATLSPFTLGPGACRLFSAQAEKPVRLAPPIDKAGSKRSGRKSVQEAIAAPRVAIESVTPSVDHGRFPAKRTVGEAVEVKAAIFAEGHDKIAAAVQWRAADETDWHEALMIPVLPARQRPVARRAFRSIAWAVMNSRWSRGATTSLR